MKEVVIETRDFAPENTLTVWRVSFPAGHDMGHELLPTVRHFTDRWSEDEIAQEQINVSYPTHLNGGLGQPNLVNATVERVLNRLDVGPIVNGRIVS